jgi:transposase
MPKALKRHFVSRIRQAFTDDALLVALIEPSLQALEASMEQLPAYDRVVMKQTRGNETVRLLMTAPDVGPVVALAYIIGVEDPGRFSSSTPVGAYIG